MGICSTRNEQEDNDGNQNERKKRSNNSLVNDEVNDDTIIRHVKALKNYSDGPRFILVHPGELVGSP